ncbi:hypothetical protein EVJ58_g3005 [Rhodofomes roseus]|nr:hypothetical protein EVJ58_g3005 [Rhodofomes roseus]
MAVLYVACRSCNETVDLDSAVKMPQVSVASASLAAAAVESFLYGIFLILAFASIYFHFSRTAASHQDFKRTILALFNPILVGSILITITVTGHWITIVARLFDAFIYFDSGASPSAYYAMLPLPTAVVKTAFLMATLIECDTMLAYRLWILWNYNYVIVIIPALAILGQCVTMIAAMYQQTHFQAGVSDEVFLGTMSHWITAGNACTWVTNIYSSCGIAFRVWSVRQHLRPIGGPNIMNVLVTVVESAMLYL